jgi:hypothetical protein
VATIEIHSPMMLASSKKTFKGMRSQKNPRRNWNTKRECKRGKTKKSWARKGEDKREKQESNLQMPGLLMTK